MDAELIDCKTQIEKQILVLEGKTLHEVSAIKRDLEYIRGDVEQLVTMTRYRPVELLVYGGVAGVLMSALGMVMAKILGWSS